MPSSAIRRLTPSMLRVHWRHFLMVAIVAGSLALMLSQQPFGQDPTYHDFADRRTFFGIPNFFDVTSNLAFLLVGIAGLRTCLRNGFDRSRYAWIALFAGDRKSTRLNSSHGYISYAVFCLKKKKQKKHSN